MKQKQHKVFNLSNPWMLFLLVFLHLIATGSNGGNSVAAKGANTYKSSFPTPPFETGKPLSDTQSTQNPQWKILLLIYSSTDFSYEDGPVKRRVTASMSQSEIDKVEAVATRFVESDVPALTSGYMVPILTIRKPDHALTALDNACGYWPSRGNTSQDLDPEFDSVIVVWDDSGTDINTGQAVDLNYCGGLSIPNGTGQTYLAIPVDSVTYDQQNVFKHEWGHSLLSYYDAAGISPKPAVDNHINNTTNRYVNCESGDEYILVDETNDNPIPNSIYNNNSGFTHDYYSGLTAKPEEPHTCLGINQDAWSTGGPVTKPPASADILQNGGFENGDTDPAFWGKDAWDMERSEFTWDTTQKHSGNRSVKINNNTTNDARWIQVVSVQQNSDYRLSGWIKTSDIPQNDDRGANLSVLDTWISTSKLYGNHDWTYVSVEFNTEANSQIVVAARLGMYSGDTTGTAWFDDLKLELLSSPTCYILGKAVVPVGSGSISTNPPPNCNHGTQYIHGTVVELTGNPNPGYAFNVWGGDISGSSNPTYVTMTENKFIIASFAENKVVKRFRSIGLHDGWVLESGEFTREGGMTNDLDKRLQVGDNAQDKQYRAILSFWTAKIPDTAVITEVILKVKKAGVTGTDPMTTHNGLVVDIKKGKFYTRPTLQVQDFHARAAKYKIGKFSTTLYSGWYKAVLYKGAYTYINKKGRTQFRLRFILDDNDDYGTDILKLYSGNSVLANRPKLIVKYYVP